MRREGDNLSRWDAKSQRVVPTDDWLAQSWQEPSTFLQALLHQHAGEHQVSLTSVLGQRVALVDDAVSRYCQSSRVAFETVGGHTISYAELGRHVDEHASYLAHHGVEPGAVVCLVISDPVVLATGVLAAWKIGATVSFVAPRGPLFVGRRLALLQPDFVVVADPDGRWFRDYQQAPVLRASGRESTPLPPGSYAFEPEALAARLFSPFAAEPEQPLNLSADALLAGATRDGILLFGLRPGEVLAAPSLDPQRHEPSLSLCVLLAGATRRIVGDATDVKLGHEPYDADIVGLTGAEYHAAAAGRLDLRASRRSFYALAEPLDVFEVQQSASSMIQRKSPPILTLGCSATGGTFAWAPRPEQPGLLEMLPAPGLSFEFTDPATPHLQAVGAGVLTVHNVDAQASGTFIFGRHQGRFYFGGSILPSSGGETYLRRDIEAVAAQVEGVESVVAVPGPGLLPNDGRLTLVVYVDPWAAPSSMALLAETLARAVTAELGPQTGLDAIEVFPLLAPGDEDAVDPVRCESEYLSGSLSGRRRDPLFGDVARLRKTLRALATLEAAS